MSRDGRFYNLLLAGVVLAGTALSVVWAIASTRFEHPYRLVAEQHIKSYEEVPVLVSGNN